MLDRELHQHTVGDVPQEYTLPSPIGRHDCSGNEMRVRERQEVEASKEPLILPDFPLPPATSPHPLEHHTKLVSIHLQY